MSSETPKLSLDDYHDQKLKGLQDGDAILYYHEPSHVYRLGFLSGMYVLARSGPLPFNARDWPALEFEVTEKYPDLQYFWDDLTADRKWYVRFTHLNAHSLLSVKVAVLAKFIITFFNGVRRTHEFTFAESINIWKWSSLVHSNEYNDKAIRQWCPNCFQEVGYNERYPKYICAQCHTLEKCDEKGNILEFYNVDYWGGLRIVYKDRAGQTIREDTSREYCECLIDGKVFFVEEGKFGGIVIQKKE